MLFAEFKTTKGKDNSFHKQRYLKQNTCASLLAAYVLKYWKKHGVVFQYMCVVSLKYAVGKKYFLYVRINIMFDNATAKGIRGTLNAE
jgi:hypothetical protein